MGKRKKGPAKASQHNSLAAKRKSKEITHKRFRCERFIKQTPNLHKKIKKRRQKNVNKVAKSPTTGPKDGTGSNWGKDWEDTRSIKEKYKDQ